MAKPGDLPLLYKTPDKWIETALSDVLELLNDHAHLERKAAINALELINRWPDPNAPSSWVPTMAAVAHDEAEHLQTVVGLMAQRGGRLSKDHKNPYASGLRKLVRRGEGNRELLDRLIVSALIEARSCERFEILGRLCPDERLARLYAELWESEHTHYRIFLALAKELIPDEVEPRWQEMLQLESKVLQDQSPGPRMHSHLS
jgi:tRNA 2-(methylsulfanyl)-N6-isopentenyladenosine37 hydroxylase